MTDRLIIHGIDVSGCGYIDHDSAWCELCMTNCAEETNPCYYKRLKRKEEECEWWKRQAELGSDTTDRLTKQLEKKEQELDYCRENLHKQLEQLKEKNEILEKDKANLDVIIETLKAQFKQLENENKDLEIEKYKDLALHNGKVCNERLDKIDELEHKVNRMEKGYAELTEIVAPYIDDFTGYNEEQCGFDIVLCVRELMQQLDQLKEEVEKQRALKQTYLTCYKTKHGDVKGKLFKYERYKEILQEIKNIAEVQQSWNDWNMRFSETESEDDIFAYNWSALKQILQKISEVLNDE